MSNKLAKVLLICALVVCLPLFIAGTVLAVYYSTNASTNIAIYVDAYSSSAPSITSSGRVTNNLNDEDKGCDIYTVTNSHVKDTSIAFVAEGYDFVGWFEGDYETYVRELGTATTEEPIEYYSTKEVLTVKLADFSDFVAVFNIHTFDVAYSYDADPDNEGGETTEIPADGKGTYKYGEKLPVLENTYKHEFLGWSVNGGSEIFTHANFEDIEGTITLSAVWKEYVEFSYSFSYDYSNDAEPTVVENTKTIEDINKAINSGTFFPSLESVQKEGQLAYWGDMNGNRVTAITSEMLDAYAGTKVIPFKVYYEDLSYTINVTIPTDVSFAGEGSVTVEYSDLDEYLETLMNKTNWSHNLYKNSWEFKGVKVNETLYANDSTGYDNLRKLIIESSEPITVTGVVECLYTSVHVSGTFEAKCGLESVYDEEQNDYNNQSCDYTVDMSKDMYYYSTDTSASGLFGMLDLSKTYYNSADVGTRQEVTIIGFTFEYNGNDYRFDFSAFADDSSIYNLIEKVVADSSAMAGDTFEISNIIVFFE